MAERTYKLLIADDEYWTREKIRHMIVWEEYHIIFMEPAENGEEVLKKIEADKPDILITDINMPIINGVELVAAVKERYPEIVVFIISGYDDFSYVKSTLMAGAINYLLKPVTKIDLVNAVSRALEIISREEDNKLTVLKASSLIQDREFSLLVEKEAMPFTPAIHISGNMDYAGCSLMLLKIHNMQEWMEKYQYDMNLLSYKIKRSIKELTGNEDLLIFNHIYRSNEFIIVTESDNTEQKKMAVKIANYLTGQNKSPVSVIISAHTYSIDSIHSAYTQCVALLMTRKYKKESVIIFHAVEKENTYHEVKNQVPEQKEKQLRRLLRNNNPAMLSEFIFEDVGLKNCEKQAWEYLEVKQTVKKICNIFMDYLAEVNSPQKVLTLENQMELVDRAIETLEFANLREIMEDLITIVSDVKKEEAVGGIREVVAKAARYIDENYFEELTLVSLAERFHVESSYFSKLFRQETGDNLMFYIAKKRIEKAKEYMKDSSLSLTEIAFMTGYDDYTYFSKVFRKMTGTSPREYRGSKDDRA